MATAKTPERVGDRTRTARATAHLERLEEAQGKRVVVDLGKIEREALEGLLDAGYAATQSDVIRKALTQAAAAQLKKA